MLNNTTVTFAGNLADDVELRFTPSGKAVAEFRVLVNRRVQNDAQEWEDGEPTGHTVKLWGPAAENLAESAERGTRVMVNGTMHTETWPDRDNGEKRYKQIVTADEVAVSVAWATLKITKNN